MLKAQSSVWEQNQSVHNKLRAMTPQGTQRIGRLKKMSQKRGQLEWCGMTLKSKYTGGALLLPFVLQGFKGHKSGKSTSLLKCKIVS